MTGRSITKEVHRLRRNIDSVFNGQADIQDCEFDADEKKVVVELTPNDGPYYGGKFAFEIYLDDTYPDTPPQVGCLTNIYHPNIDPTISPADGNVCLNLFDEWQSSFGVEDCIQGFLFLLYNPNLADPLSPIFDSSVEEYDFMETVKRTLMYGEEVDGIVFEKNWHLAEPEPVIQESHSDDQNDVTTESQSGNQCDAVVVILQDIQSQESEKTNDQTTEDEILHSGETNNTVTRDDELVNEFRELNVENTNYDTDDHRTVANDLNQENSNANRVQSDVGAESTACVIHDVRNLGLSRQSSKVERQMSVTENPVAEEEPLMASACAQQERRTGREPTHHTNNSYYVDCDPTVHFLTNVLYLATSFR